MTYRRPQGPQSRRKTSYQKVDQRPENLSIHLSTPTLNRQVHVRKVEPREPEPFSSFTDMSPTYSSSKSYAQNDHHLQHEIILGTITSKNPRTGPFNFKLQVGLPRHEQQRLQQIFDDILDGLSLTGPNITSVEDSHTSDVIVNTYRHRHNLRSSINSRERSLAPPPSSTLAHPLAGNDFQPRKRQWEPGSANDTVVGRRDTRRKKLPNKWLLDGSLRCGNPDELREFFHARFRVILQNPCKQVQQRIIEAIISKKSSQYPYGAPGQAKSPDFWPKGIQWQGPDRMDTNGRLVVLTHIFTLPLIDKDECHAILFSHKYCGHGDDKARESCNRKWDTWKQLLETVLLLQRGEDGETALNLREKYPESVEAHDHESNNIRHQARLQVVEELINIAGAVEDCAEGIRDEKSEITFCAIPEKTTLTPHKHIYSLNSARKATKSSDNMAATDQRHQIRDIPTIDDADSETEMDSDSDQDAASFEKDVSSHTIIGTANAFRAPIMSTDTRYQTCPPSAATSFGSSNTTVQGFGGIGLQSAGDADSTYIESSQQENRAGVHDRGRPGVVYAPFRGFRHVSPTPQASSIVPQPEPIGNHSIIIPQNQDDGRQARFVEGRSPSGWGYRSKSAGPQPIGVPSALCFDRSLGNSVGMAEHDGYQRPSSRYMREESVKDWNYGRSWWGDPFNGAKHAVGGSQPAQLQNGDSTDTVGMLPGPTPRHNSQQRYTQHTPHSKQQHHLEQHQFDHRSARVPPPGYYEHGHMVVDAAMTNVTPMPHGYDDCMHASVFQSFAPQEEMQGFVTSSPEFTMTQEDNNPYAQSDCNQVLQAQSQHAPAQLYSMQIPGQQYLGSQQTLIMQHQQQYDNGQYEQQVQQFQHHRQQYQQDVPYEQWQGPHAYPNPVSDCLPQPGGFCASALL